MSFTGQLGSGDSQLGNIVLGEFGESASYGFGQAQASILQTYRGYGQAQAFILGAGNGHGQAQGSILQVYNIFAQAQTQIKQVYQGYGQAQGLIKRTERGYGQAQAWICWSDTFTRTTSFGLGSDYTWIEADTSFAAPEDSTYEVDGSKVINNPSNNGNFDSYQLNIPVPYEGTLTFQFRTTGTLSGSTHIAVVWGTDYDSGYYSVAAYIVNPPNGWRLSTAWASGGAGSSEVPVTILENTTYTVKMAFDSQGNHAAKIWDASGSEPDWMALGKMRFFALTDQVWIDFFYDESIEWFDNLEFCIPSIYPKNGFAQARAVITRPIAFGQARARIRKFDNGRTGQARARIKIGRWSWAQAQALINLKLKTGQAQAFILAAKTSQFGQAQARILGRTYGQAQAMIINDALSYAQAQAYISAFGSAKFGQARAQINRAGNQGYGNAQALIFTKVGFGQAQARISSDTINVGQSQAYIDRPIKHGLAQAFIQRDAAGKLVLFNGYYLPGYLQFESLPSEITIEDHITHTDGSLSEYAGLTNKLVSIRMKINESTYAENKNKLLEAGTLLRSNRSDFAPLFVKHTDKYYLALTKNINAHSTAGEERVIDYVAEFECKPWLYGAGTYTLIDNLLLDTNTVNRTYLNGTWTPVRLNVTGTNVTVSGYTETGDFTGFISVSGAVSNLVIDTEIFSVKLSGQERNDLINNYDYSLYVGPGRTFFAVTGASEVVIEYEDRWAL